MEIVEGWSEWEGNRVMELIEYEEEKEGEVVAVAERNEV